MKINLVLINSLTSIIEGERDALFVSDLVLEDASIEILEGKALPAYEEGSRLSKKVNELNEYISKSGIKASVAANCLDDIAKNLNYTTAPKVERVVVNQLSEKEAQEWREDFAREDVVVDMSTAAPQLAPSANAFIVDAEEMLLEMDANNTSEIVLKEGFGATQKITRDQVMNSLHKNSIKKEIIMDIKENTFAEACFNNNSAEELQAALVNGPDATDMKTWGISESEWTENVQLAIAALNNNSDI